MNKILKFLNYSFFTEKVSHNHDTQSTTRTFYYKNE